MLAQRFDTNAGKKLLQSLAALIAATGALRPSKPKNVSVIIG
jgi:hypothetical protein